MGQNNGELDNNWWGSINVSDILQSGHFMPSGDINDISPYYLQQIDITKGDLIPPASPTNLSFTGTNGQITIRWDADGDAASYRVFRSVMTNTYTNFTAPYALVSQAAPREYTDTQVGSGTNYYYFVTALDSASNESFYSASQLGYLDSTLPAIVMDPLSTNSTNAVTNVISASDNNPGVSIFYSLIQTNFIVSPSVFTQYSTNLLTNIFTPSGQNPFYNVSAYARDLAGNITAVTNATYYLDSGVAPALTITPSLASPFITNAALVLNLRAEGGPLSLSLWTNGGLTGAVSPTAYVYETNLTLSSQGTNTLIAYATNLISQNFSQPVTNIYIVDSLPPEVTVYAPSNTGVSLPVTITVNDYLPFTLYYSLNRGSAIAPNQNASSNISLTVTDTITADWYLVTLALDSMGNTNSEVTNIYHITAGIPELNITPAAGPTLVLSATNYNVTAVSSNGYLYYSLFTNSLSAGTGEGGSPQVVFFTQPGTNRVVFFASNTTDGSLTLPKTNTVLIDNGMPQLILSLSNGYSARGPYPLQLSATDDWTTAAIEYVLQWAATPLTNGEMTNLGALTGGASVSLTLQPQNGLTYANLLLRAVDAAGNATPWANFWFEAQPLLPGQQALFSENPWVTGSGTLIISIPLQGESVPSVRIYDLSMALAAQLTEYSLTSDKAEFSFTGQSSRGALLGRGVYLVVPVYDGRPVFQSARKLYLLTP